MVANEYRECNAVQRDVLYTLRVGDEMTGRAIAETTGRGDAAVSRALRDLADRGLVKREDADDVPGESKYNSLTDKGRAVTTAAFDAYAEAL